jgi:uroporphyrinogen decarboxylase
MNVIGLMNWLGRRKPLWLISKMFLLAATSIPFPSMVRIAGRRIVAASAGAPSVLLSGSTIKQALTNPDLLFKAVEYSVKTMGLDVLCLFVDMSLEAEACGCKVSFSDFQTPSVITHPVKTIDDLAKLKVPDPYKDGRMPVFLATMRLMKKNYNMLKIAEAIGPFTLAANLSGTEIYLDTRKNPQKVHTLLEYSEKVIIRYAQALIASGADMIIIAEPTGSQLSPTVYEDFSLAYTRKIIDSLTKPCILHICGKAGHIIEKMCQSGAVALNLDEVDMSQVIKIVPDSIVVTGNISPSKFARSSPEEIVSETSNLLETVKTRKEFILAPGCDLAPQTPLENILSMVNAARK